MYYLLAGGGGLLVLGAIYREQTLGLLRDTLRGVFGLLFTPVILETSLALGGFCLVILVNGYLRREQRDEWVEIEDDERVGGDPRE